MAEPTPWWVTTLSSLVISVVIFLLGYWLVYRKQLGPLAVQLHDRNARLSAQRAPQALEMAKAILSWYPDATLEHDNPFSGKDRLPEPEAADGAARLANDLELRSLLGQAAELLPEAHQPPPFWSTTAHGSWQARLWQDWDAAGHSGLDPRDRGNALPADPSLWTTRQIKHLEPVRAVWEGDRASWARAVEELNGVAGALRLRSERLLRESA